ncbi:hypothetical protein FIV00_25535 [Labrenzia sp. THAF82]|uniref:hypothetical protein n=1 Tax=Labrenzia sp. THAF82 TaxID=2587861 RepID=UPI0012693020|nr:hypothetical protein [Labrenzia sp. THAF82]QFT33883.1 hypothetical protein FIV00_25535 [Labrenzia sp. THAF82]
MDLQALTAVGLHQHKMNSFDPAGEEEYYAQSGKMTGLVDGMVEAVASLKRFVRFLRSSEAARFRRLEKQRAAI